MQHGHFYRKKILALNTSTTVSGTNVFLVSVRT